MSTDSRQYYTPQIEDLRVGYECELKDAAPPENDWKDWKISRYDTFSLLSKWIDAGEVRTPYLTKEQIKGEGWGADDHAPFPSEISGVSATKESTHARGKCTYTLCYICNSHHMVISVQFEGHKDHCTLFAGSIPSINELRTIMKLLKIK